MGRTSKRWLIFAAALLFFGAARWPAERAIFAAQRELGLRPEREISLELQEEIGQNAFAIALGGYRAVVATWFSLLAFESWDRLDWDALEQQYRLATTLQPHEEEYWRLAGWHLAYNASVYYEEDDGLSPVEQRTRWREAIDRGSKFFEDGARQNPDSWELRRDLGMLWSDRFKIQDPERAFNAFEEAAAIEGSPRYLKRFVIYAQADLADPEEKRAALLKAREFWEDEKHWTTSLLLRLFFLEQEVGDPERLSREWFIDKYDKILAHEDEEQAVVLEHFLDRSGREDSQVGRELVEFYRERAAEDRVPAPEQAPEER